MPRHQRGNATAKPWSTTCSVWLHPHRTNSHMFRRVPCPQVQLLHSLPGTGRTSSAFKVFPQAGHCAGCESTGLKEVMAMYTRQGSAER